MDIEDCSYLLSNVPKASMDIIIYIFPVFILLE